MVELMSVLFCVNSFNIGEDVCDYEKQMQINYEQEVTEMFVDHVMSKTNITYAFGCYGQRGCRNKYDCSGLLHSFLYENGVNSPRMTSWGAKQEGEPIPLAEAKRGDLVHFRKYYGEGPDHIAFVWEPFDGNSLQIVDLIGGDTSPRVRTLKLRSGKYYNLEDKGYVITTMENIFVSRYISQYPLDMPEKGNYILTPHGEGGSQQKKGLAYLGTGIEIGTIESAMHGNKNTSGGLLDHSYLQSNLTCDVSTGDVCIIMAPKDHPI